MKAARALFVHEAGTLFRQQIRGMALHVLERHRFAQTQVRSLGCNCNPVLMFRLVGLYFRLIYYEVEVHMSAQVLIVE